jgi:hypothetical protein
MEISQMGSVSSTRWRWHKKKLTVEECLSLDINKLVRGGLISGQGVGGKIRFKKTVKGQLVGPIRFVVWSNGSRRRVLHLFFTVELESKRQGVEQQIQLQTTKPYFGGVRWWFTCPIRSERNFCNGRVGKLYLPPNAHYFTCRNCHDLTYRSSQESDKRISFLKKNPEIIHAALEGGCRSLSELRLIEKAMNRIHRKGLSVSEAVRRKEF